MVKTGRIVFDAWEASFTSDEDSLKKEQEPLTWTDSFGTKLNNVHKATLECLRYGCSIHFPTDPNRHMKQLYRMDRHLMERVCEHGVGHPDLDHINWVRRKWGDETASAESVHGCDGCCSGPKEGK